jgi:surface carbohydrate biosynthesis protein (TIGR04326 family)
MKKFLIWDSLEKFELVNYDSYNVILWRSDSQNSVFFSIPEYIESNKNYLRNTFQKWVFEIGQIKYNGKTIVELNSIRNDFSYWWLTEFSEMQHYGKDSYIYDLFRLISLESHLTKFDVTEILLITDRNLKSFDSLKEWALNKKINFEIKYLKDCSGNKNKPPSPIALIIKGIAFLFVHILERFINKSSTLKSIDKINDCLFFDYYFNETQYSKSKFNSQYWTKLVQIVEDSALNAAWHHLWLKSDSPQSLSLKQVGYRIKELNTYNDRNLHFIINGQLRIGLLFKIIFDYFNIIRKSKTLPVLKSNFAFPNSSFNFFPLFYNSFLNNYFGPQAMWNAICLNSFEYIFKSAPVQKKAFYLQENTPWEMCLIYAWKKYNHGTIIGVPHATVRFWDLRYFPSILSYNISKFSKPQPQFYAVNSKHAKINLIEGGLEESKIKEVEALRYLYLNNYIANIKENQNTILLLGDYSFDSSQALISMFLSAWKNIQSDHKIVFKPHPGAELIPELNENVTLSVDSLSNLIESSDLVVTTNSTSSAVDAYCMQKKLIIIRDYDTFNMSPLLDFDNVDFVSNSEELKNRIEFQLKNNSNEIIKNNFFYTSADVKKWIKIIESNEFEFKN